MPRILLKERGAFGNADTGGAWLSSARAFGLQAATRLHEAGIASNRRSEPYGGESVPGPCTHRPVTLWELAMPEVVTLTARRGMPKAGASDWSEVVTR
ncbi:hypothetical protein L1887_47696 [Cichorium endivia]|nr:hypothetical protein L1887_47696 [Cichorium endivia]